MAGTAGDGVVGLGVGQLREVGGVEVVGHFDHQAGFVFDRVCIGGEVVAFGLGVACVTVLALNAERALVLMHDLDDLIAGEVFGKNLEVGWVGTRASWWPCDLRRRSVLSQSKLSGERYCHGCEEQGTKRSNGPKRSIHSGKCLLYEVVELERRSVGVKCVNPRQV